MGRTHEKKEFLIQKTTIMKTLELKTLRELNVFEQENLKAGTGQTICNCGNICDCFCVGKDLPAKSTSRGNGTNVKSQKKQGMGLTHEF